MKLKDITPDGWPVRTIMFYCPGCREIHLYQLPPWTFNEDFEKPTFRASLLHQPHWRMPPGWKPEDSPKDAEGKYLHDAEGHMLGAVLWTCHLFVTDGKIEYCGDCTHELAGKTVDLPDLPEWAI